MNTNVTIQDILTALLYWRSKAKEYEAQRDRLFEACRAFVAMDVPEAWDAERTALEDTYA